MKTWLFLLFVLHLPIKCLEFVLFFVFALWRLNDFFIKISNDNHVADSSLISTFNSDEEGSYSDFYPIIPANLMSVKEILNMDACHRTWWVFWACKMLNVIYWTANLEREEGREISAFIFLHISDLLQLISVYRPFLICIYLRVQTGSDCNETFFCNSPLSSFLLDSCASWNFRLTIAYQKHILSLILPFFFCHLSVKTQLGIFFFFFFSILECHQDKKTKTDCWIFFFTLMTTGTEPHITGKEGREELKEELNFTFFQPLLTH